MHNTIKVYNDFAKQYCDYLDERLPQYNLTKFISYLLKYRIDEIYTEVNKRVKKKSKKKKVTNKLKILDVGCSGGRDVGYLMDEGFDVIGIDASEKIIKEAKKRVKKGKFKVMDISSLDYKKETFDGLWCLGPIAHIKKKEVPKTLKGFFDVLKKNGILFLSTLEGEGEKIIERRELGGKKAFYSFFRQKEIEDLLLESGFELMTSITEELDENYITIFAKKIS